MCVAVSVSRRYRALAATKSIVVALRSLAPAALSPGRAVSGYLEASAALVVRSPSTALVSAAGTDAETAQIDCRVGAGCS
jgi:hypothetical protein